MLIHKQRTFILLIAALIVLPWGTGQAIAQSPDPAKTKGSEVPPFLSQPTGKRVTPAQRKAAATRVGAARVAKAKAKLLDQSVPIPAIDNTVPATEPKNETKIKTRGNK